MKRRVLALLMAAAMTVGMMGCGAVAIDGEGESKETSSSESESGSGSVGLAISTLNNPFFVKLAEGAEAAADSAGCCEYEI